MRAKRKAREGFFSLLSLLFTSFLVDVGVGGGVAFVLVLFFFFFFGFCFFFVVFFCFVLAREQLAATCCDLASCV